MPKKLAPSTASFSQFYDIFYNRRFRKLATQIAHGLIAFLDRKKFTCQSLSSINSGSVDDKEKLMSRWFVCAIAIPLALVPSGVHAQSTPGVGRVQSATMQKSILDGSTRNGTALIKARMKFARANVAASGTFENMAVSHLANRTQSMVATRNTQRMTTLYNTELRALNQKSSPMSSADRVAAIAALKAGYTSAMTTDASSANAANTVDIRNANGDGSMRTVSFRIASDQLTALQTGGTQNSQGGTTATSLKGLQTFWSEVGKRDKAEAKGSFDEHLVTAFGASLSATGIGCKAFAGLYRQGTDGSYTAAGC